MAKIKKYDVHAIGRRKSSVARVYVVKGTGTIKVNNRDLKEYFPLGTQRFVIHQPLNLTKNLEKYDLNVNVAGGGTTGQSEAIRLGISRAICKLDPSTRDMLKKAGFLTRDAREVERKKYGKAGARKSFQFSKR